MKKFNTMFKNSNPPLQAIVGYVTFNSAIQGTRQHNSLLSIETRMQNKLNFPLYNECTSLNQSVNLSSW